VNNLVSIIIPVYNTGKYLEECMKSVLSQTYKEIEIILIDDGSTDQSPQICDQYQKEYERVKVIHQPNQGLSAARNRGIEQANGKYLMFVDSDDYINVNMVETLYFLLSENNADMSMCSFEYVTDRGENSIVYSNPVKNELLSKIEILNKLLEDKSWYYVVAWNKLYKKEIWHNLRYPVGYIHEDAAVVHRVFCQCNLVATTEKKLYYYRQVPGSLMNSGRNIKSLDKYMAIADRLVFLKKFEKELDIKKMANQYWYHYLEDYFFFKGKNGSSIYLRRMRKSLYRVFFILVKVKLFTTKEMLSVFIFLLSPNIYYKIFGKNLH